MLRIHFYVLCFCLFWRVTCIFSFSIEGTIVDSASRLPISQVNVRLVGNPAGTISGLDGSFSLNGDVFPCELILTHIGYDEIRLVYTSSGKKQILLHARALPGPTVMVSSTRAIDRQTPVSFSNIDRPTIERTHTTEDIPYLISSQPNVMAYSDAGNGIGYSYLKIRGFDQKRIGVMINNIPLNDPEEHQVYWVDLGDLIGNTRDIQIQRGVGSTIYGSSTFGGSVNILTRPAPGINQYSFQCGTGSFQTYKIAGSINHVVRPSLSILLRSSFTASDGFRDRSQSDLVSYYMAVCWQKPKMMISLLCFGGFEKTGLAYNAIPESIYRKNRTYNDMANYSNSIDHFVQPHFQLIHSYQLSHWLVENTLFYIYGKGFYEQYKDGIDNDKRISYSLPLDSLDRTTNLVRRKWVIKNQAGWLARIEWKNERHTLSVGWNLWDFHSNHFGKVIQLGDQTMDHRYHDYSGAKQNYSVYLSEVFSLTDHLGIMVNGLWEYKKYVLTQNQVGNFQGLMLNHLVTTYRFFSPRIGLNLNVTPRLNLFVNYSQAQREPADQDLYDTWSGPDDLGSEPLFNHKSIHYAANGQPVYQQWSDPQVKSEHLHDGELGLGYVQPWLQLKMNLYWMQLRNEIVPLGTINAEGIPVRGNAPESIHRGIEWHLISPKLAILRLEVSGSYSQNYFTRFMQKNWNDNWSGSIEVDLKNKTIALFPDWIVTIQPGFEWNGLEGSLNFRYLGRQYLDNMQVRHRSIEPFWVTQIMLRYFVPDSIIHPGLMVYLKIDNVFDRVYEGSGYVDVENCYFPGAPRNFFAGLKWGF